MANLTTTDLMLIEQRVANDGKKTGTAYLFLIFLWWVSAHRFYLGRPLSAVIQIVSYFLLIGLVWAVIDLFLVPSMVRAENDKLRSKVMQTMGHQFYSNQEFAPPPAL